MTTVKNSKKPKLKSKAQQRNVTLRQVEFPNDIYSDVKMENLLDDRDGKKQNTENTIIDLVADGIKFRKAQRENSVSKQS